MPDPNSITFEVYIRTRLEARANVQIHLGQAVNGSEVSFFSHDDKLPGTYFWRVVGDTVTLIQFIGTERTT